ncbi:flagellar basal body-associated protein FliL [Marinobacter sp.]|uniref:flagellar basal body-associated FliL family protein n=1 Tax=Marinobacter sp. TaxID=50741 RepID=UPI0019E1D62F|nr:flagellar basal body-associated FliL family protein [Marinobacter sp.]MBE0486531.1 flagellar basal body-associated FliL family protein [Marinobacter sp.]
MIFKRNTVLVLLLTIYALVAGPAFAEDEPEERGITDYIEMEPAFVTHVGEPGNQVVYLKAAVTMRASRESTRPALVAHMPRLRHELVMLFGEQTNVDQLTTQQGQQALREAAAERINAALTEQQTGERIADVLFTEFVVQR